MAPGGRPQNNPLWKYAEKTNERGVFKCKLCTKKFAGNMTRHFKSIHPEEINKIQGGCSSVPSTESNQESTPNAATMQNVRKEPEDPSNPGRNLNDPSQALQTQQPGGIIQQSGDSDAQNTALSKDGSQTWSQFHPQFSPPQLPQLGSTHNDWPWDTQPLVWESTPTMHTGGPESEGPSYPGLHLNDPGYNQSHQHTNDDSLSQPQNPTPVGTVPQSSFSRPGPPQLPQLGSTHNNWPWGEYRPVYLGDQSISCTDIQGVNVTGGGSSVAQSSFSSPSYQAAAYSSSMDIDTQPLVWESTPTMHTGGPESEGPSYPGLHLNDPGYNQSHQHTNDDSLSQPQNPTPIGTVPQFSFSRPGPSEESHQIEMNAMQIESDANSAGLDDLLQDQQASLPEQFLEHFDDRYNAQNKKLSPRDLVGEKPHNLVSDIYRLLTTTNGISRIGVWGMGGAGKTLTLKHLHDRICDESPAFDVRWVTVSKKCSIRALQKKIAKQTDAPELFEGKDVASWKSLLHSHLEKKTKLLICLDDLWKDFELKDVVGVPDCVQIVLTTRDLKVCEKMSCQPRLKVVPLCDEDAWSLFVKIHGSEPSAKHKHDAEEIVKMCRGLPLAIEVMAGSMKAMKTDHGWRDTLADLKGSKYAQEDMQEKVLPVLRYSYDRLDEKKKQCLLRCALYPEDHLINRVDLIEFCIDEEVIHGKTMRKRHDKGQHILDELGKACLLEPIILGKGIHSTSCVRMHDLIRDMALNITNENSLCPYLVISDSDSDEMWDLEHWPSNLQKASLIADPEIEVQDIPPNCPELSTLLITCSTFWCESAFFKKLHGLKVLDLSCPDITFLPDSIKELKKLQALSLRSCEKLSMDNFSLENLISLRKLDLHGCSSIDNVPHGLEKLVKLRHLDLQYTGINEIPDGVIIELVELQYLSVNCYRELKAEDLRTLKKLEALRCRLQNLNGLDGIILESYIIAIANDEPYDPYDFLHMGKKDISLCGVSYDGETCNLPRDVKQLKIEDIRGMPNISIFTRLEDVEGLHIISCKQMSALSGGQQQQEPSSQLPSDHCPNLTDLVIDGCPELVHLMVGGRSCDMHLTNLKMLHIWKCEKLEGLMDTITVKELPPHSFSQLQGITISSCPNLKHVVSPDMLFLAPSTAAGKLTLLTEVNIRNCDKMKRLLTLDVFIALRNLNRISIVSCKEMEEVIGQDEDGCTSRSDTNTPLHGSRKLQLILKDLPELTSICSWNPAIVGSIRLLDVRTCPKLERIPELGSPPFPSSLEKVVAYPPEWWESLKWEHDLAKRALEEGALVLAEEFRHHVADSDYLRD